MAQESSLNKEKMIKGILEHQAGRKMERAKISIIIFLLLSFSKLHLAVKSKIITLTSFSKYVEEIFDTIILEMWEGKGTFHSDW